MTNICLQLKNIVRITKRCSENITSVVECVKLLFQKNTNKVFKLCIKKRRRKKVAVVTAVTVVPVVKKSPTSQKNNFFFSEHFWKKQFDTFDNRCDVFRAAFCDSRDV